MFERAHNDLPQLAAADSNTSFVRVKIVGVRRKNIGARFGGGSDLGSFDAGRSATSLAACIFAALSGRLVKLVAQLLRLIDNLPWASAKEGRDLGCGFVMLDAPLQVPEVPLAPGLPRCSYLRRGRCQALP